MKKDIVVFKIKNMQSGRSILSGLSHSAASHTDILYHTATSVNDPTMGSIFLNREYAKENARVQIYVSPVTGHELTSYTVTPSWLTIENNKFNMPKCDVSIIANFEIATPTSVWYWNDTANSTIHLSNSKLDDNYVGGTDTSFQCYQINQNATKVVIDNEVRPSTCNMAFYNLQKLTSIEGIENLNTRLVEDMSLMFSNNRVLSSIDTYMSHLNTSRVTNLTNMLWNCKAITSFDTTLFDTSKVTDFSSMFNNCTGLTSVNVTNLVTANAKSLYGLFSMCSNLASIDVTSWDTCNVENMNGVFNSCSKLTSIDVSTWDTSKVTNMNYMFIGTALTSIDLRNWDTSNVLSVSYMFQDCNSFTSLDVSYLKFPKCKNFMRMFAQCANLTYINLSGINPQVTQSNPVDLVTACRKLVTVDLSGITSDYIVASQFFDSCEKLTTIYCNSDWSSKCSGSRLVFCNCYSLPGWDYSKEGGAYAKPRSQGGYFTTK